MAIRDVGALSVETVFLENGGLDENGETVTFPETSRCRETKIAERHVLSFNCLAIALTAGIPSRGGLKPSLVVKRQFGTHCRRQFGRGQFQVKNYRETMGRQFLPQDIWMSRTALCVATRTRGLCSTGPGNPRN